VCNCGRCTGILLIDIASVASVREPLAGLPFLLTINTDRECNYGEPPQENWNSSSLNLQKSFVSTARES
jgi:hypothetical protein